MAQKVQVTLVDDLDGSEAVETVSFAIDGTSYEIDLNQENAAALRDDFARYVGAARRAGRSTGGSGTGRRSSGGTSRPASGGTDREEVQRIREWARENGHKVSERGRLSSSVLEAYRAAH